jgi:hypothetical protein
MLIYLVKFKRMPWLKQPQHMIQPQLFNIEYPEFKPNCPPPPGTPDSSGSSFISPGSAG